VSAARDCGRLADLTIEVGRLRAFGEKSPAVPRAAIPIARSM
jgi:hypothetical protein